MIGKLRGLVDVVLQDSVILDVSGVGYHLFCSAKALGALPDTGQGCTLLVDMHVREDHIHLYGFLQEEERQWFRLLMTVQGVGAKMALEILSALTPSELVIALAAQDKTQLTRAKGVGQKLAARLLTELKDKAPLAGASSEMKVKSITAPVSAYDDAMSALVHLGYGRGEAFQALSTVRGQAPEDAPLDKIIPLALKVLVS